MVFAIQLLFFIVRLDRTIHAAVLRERFTRARHAVTGFVYILASQKNGTLYVGVTADIPRRMHEHRTGVTPGFASKYGAIRLVWYEEHFDFGDAVKREKAIKGWNRQWKIDLIEKDNPEWHELFKGLWW